MRYAGPFNFITMQIKVRFITNFSHCTTTSEVFVLLTSCLNAIEISCYEKSEKVYETNVKNYIWSIENSGKILNKFRSKGF